MWGLLRENESRFHNADWGSGIVRIVKGGRTKVLNFERGDSD